MIRYLFVACSSHLPALSLESSISPVNYNPKAKVEGHIDRFFFNFDPDNVYTYTQWPILKHPRAQLQRYKNVSKDNFAWYVTVSSDVFPVILWMTTGVHLPLTHCYLRLPEASGFTYTLTLCSPQGGCWSSWKGHRFNCQRDWKKWQSAGPPGGEHGPDQLRKTHQWLQGSAWWILPVPFLKWLSSLKIAALHSLVGDLFFCLSLAFTVQGLVSNLTLGKNILQDWTMYSLSIDQTLSQGLLRPTKTKEAPQPPNTSVPTFYEGNFIIPDGIPDLPQDTYIRLPNWTKACCPHTSKHREINSHRVVVFLCFYNCFW